MHDHAAAQRQRPNLTQHRLQAMWMAAVQLGEAACTEEDYETYAETMWTYVNALRNWWEEKHERDLFSDAAALRGKG